MVEEQFCFGPFRCDPMNARVWHGEEAVALTPKAFNVLLYLLRHPGQLVNKDELLKAVWPETYVGDAVLKVSVGEIRKVLADDPKTPRFIETVHRRGYRFIAPTSAFPQPVASSQYAVASREEERQKAKGKNQTAKVEANFPASSPQSSSPSLVGRDSELAQLHSLLVKALGGERQFVFVTGEPGIGKTALVETFLPQIDARGSISARGQCLEHYGVGEAYLPVFEAFGRLGRESGRERLVQVLGQYAPTWLAQMPALISSEDRQQLQRELLGATPERMLREMSEAIEALTAETPLVLVLEDLHWSDYATLDLLAALARRRESARLLVIGTYRPVDIIVSGHPLRGLKQELQGHRQCEEIPLNLLTTEEVGIYLNSRLPGGDFSTEFVKAIHERTDGNPLFLLNFVDYLAVQNILRRTGDSWELYGGAELIRDEMPESIRQMIERQVERLRPEEQRMLEAASVAGMEFAAATVEAVLEEGTEQVEEYCERLIRQQQFLRAGEAKTWPDGTVTSTYGFTHALYQHALLQRVTAMRRLRFHLRIGERLESAYRSHLGEVAAELAVHFEQGRDYSRAVHYWLQAAKNAVQRHAPREAIAVLTQAAALATRVPGAEQWRLRMPLLAYRGLVHRSMGMMAQAAEDFMSWAECAHASGNLTEEVDALFHLASARSWFDREQCLATVEQGIALSAQLRDEALRIDMGGRAAYWRLLWDKWRDEDALACAQAVASARRSGVRSHLGFHVRRLTYFQALQARYGEACRAAEEGTQIALEEGDASEYLTGLFFWAWTLLHHGQWGELRRLLGEGLRLAERNGHRQWATLFRLELAWLYVQVGDFSSARNLCEAAVQESHAIHFAYGQHLSAVLLGYAHLGLGEYTQALKCFDGIWQRFRRERLLMDWICSIPLVLGVSIYWLAQKRFDCVQQEAERLCELAAQPGERTYLALGHHLLAEVALAQRKWEDAEHEVAIAFAALEGVEAPLAEWRVYASAARIAEQRRRKAQARTYWEHSKVVLLRLADSFEHNDPLRQTFLMQPTVKTIVERS